MVIVTKAQRGNGRSCWTGQVFGGGCQGCGTGRWPVIDIGNGSADSATGGIPCTGGAGTTVGHVGDVVLDRVAGAGRQRHAGIGQPHGQGARCTKIISRRNKAHLTV